MGSTAFERFDNDVHQTVHGHKDRGVIGRLNGCFGCCFRQHDATLNDHSLQPLNLFQHRSQNSVELLMDKTARAREDMWQQIGSLQPLVLSHMVNSALLGGPKWPALRQAFRVIRRHNSGNIILATDGLSDPFDDTLGRPTSCMLIIYHGTP